MSSSLPPPHVRLLTEWEDCFKETVRLMMGDRPFFLGRVGGSDTDAVVDYLAATNEEALRDVTHCHLARVMKFNGFYDTENSPESFYEFLRVMLTCYQELNKFALVGKRLLNIYFPNNIHMEYREQVVEGSNKYQALIQNIADHHNSEIECFPYPFFEKLVSAEFTLFRAFSRALPGKRVLVLSPFSKSIETNFENRSSFFKEYQYPEFELLTVNTPITYSGLPKDFYPHPNWFATVESLKSELMTIEFDIALLACGSYAV
ncbi:MAG: hypothetical protein JO307_26590, partial [Bryobacterales bacterium]|nr:hypothetical protein [Bryobacterales bacterium]